MTASTSCEDYRKTVLARSAAAKPMPPNEEQVLGAIWTDDALGALLSALEAKGMLDNTFVAVMMDHGIVSKTALFENGVRVSLMARYPPLLGKASTFGGLVTNLDLAKTVLELSGATAGFGLDGVSFAQVVGAGQAMPNFWSDRCIFFEMDYDRSARCGCHKIIGLGAVADSTTFERAGTLGYSQNTVQVYKVCDESGGDNIDLVAVSSSAATKTSLLEQLACHDARTAPGASPTYAACGLEFSTSPSSPSPSSPSPSSPSPSSPSPPSSVAAASQAASTLVVGVATVAAATVLPFLSVW